MNYSNMIEEKNLKKTFIIATLISTVIGTFTTGINLYERVGEKRRQVKKDSGQDGRIKELEHRLDEADKERQRHERRADDLQQSLTRGGPRIQQEYDRDFQRMGPRFAEGDAITQTQLQSQVITLQGTVIGLLEDALYTGRIADVNKLYNASEFAREGSINALRQQYQRMLQAAPVRRPIGPVRRISSTPSLSRRTTTRSIKGSNRQSERVKEVNEERDDIGGAALMRSGSDRISETAGGNMFDASGPLFCQYAIALQDDEELEVGECFGAGGTQACPACGTKILVEAGRAWKIDKEVVHERISTPKYDDEVVEERTYLMGNRFVIKCHREGAGFACALCYRFRERDTLCESLQGLVKHVWQRHGVEEYEREPDIKEVSVFEKNVRKGW